MNHSKLAVTRLKGSVIKCGSAYGEMLESQIMGWCNFQLKPDKERLRYARKCWKHVEQYAPVSADFMKGVASGARLSIEHITLLTLHEEIVRAARRNSHCTAFAASGEATGGDKTILAMNWDWSPSTYQWPGMLKLEMEKTPRTMTYHYPGMWSCAGINEYGVSLMWTSSGKFPKMGLTVGLPTYVLISEMLRSNSVDAALRYISKVKNAGSFIFLLGDANGRTAVVEGMPGHLAFSQSASSYARANHYTYMEMISYSGQDPVQSQKLSTFLREKRMQALIEKYNGKMNLVVAKKILTERQGKWPWLHQYPGGKDGYKLDVMTIDSLIAICKDRVLYTARGGRSPGSWQRLSF